VKAGTHHAYHLALPVAHVVRLADHRRIAAEPGLPQRVADHARAVFIRWKWETAQDWLGAECGEEARRGPRHRDALDAIAHPQRGGAAVEDGHVFHQLRLLPVLKVELLGQAEFLR
jgi:hypothetical protein